MQKNAAAKTTTVTNTMHVCPGTIVNLGGVKYVMPPISLGAIEREGESFSRLFEGSLGVSDLSMVTKLITESLKRNYPDLDRESVANAIDLGNFAQLTKALMNSSDLVTEIPATVDPIAVAIAR